MIVEQFLDMMLAERGIASNSYLAYKKDLLDYMDFLNKLNVSCEQASQENIRSYIQILSKEGLHSRSIARKNIYYKKFL